MIRLVGGSDLQTTILGVTVIESFNHIQKIRKPIRMIEVVEPAAPPVGDVIIFLDIADGGLKIKFDSGTVETLATYT